MINQQSQTITNQQTNFAEIDNHMKQIQNLISSGQYQNCITKINDLISKIGKKSGLLKLKAKVFLKLNKSQQANLIYEEFRKLNTITPDIAEDATFTSLKIKNYQNIKQYANDIQDLTLRRLMLGDSCFLVENYIEAAIHYNHIISIDETNEVVKARKLATLLKLKDFEKAMIQLDDLIKINNANNIYYGDRAFTLVKLGKPDEAIKDFEKSITLKSNKKIELNYLLTILDKNKPKAFQLLKKLSENIQQQQEQILISLINVYEYQNSYDNAHKLCLKYKDSFFKNSKSFRLKFAIVKLHLKQPQIPQALKILQILYSQFPQDFQVVFNYCRFIGKHEQDRAKSLITILNKLEKQIKSNRLELSAEYYNTLGFLYSKANQNKLAIEYYEKAIKLSGLKAVYRYNLAIVLLKQNRMQQSRYQLSRSINMNHNNKKYQKLEQSISNLENMRMSTYTA